MFISLTLFSQVEKPIAKGNFLIGGSASANYSYKTVSVGFYPSFGYFLVDGLAFGLSISTSLAQEFGDYGDSSFSIGAGPFAKFYTSSGIFIGGSVDYLTRGSKRHFTQNSKWYSTKYTSNSVSIHPEFGYAYFINSKIALEASLNYLFEFYNSSFENQPKATTKYNRIYISLGFQLFL